MPNLSKLISSWRKWLNRNQTFDKKELDEMEDHLIEEIDYLVQRENLTEEEAFHKATMDMGKRDVLDKDYKKSRILSLHTIKNWFHRYAFLMVIFSIFIITFLVVDSLFALNHFTTEKVFGTFVANMLHPISDNTFSGSDGKEILKIYWGTKENPMPTKPKFGCRNYIQDQEYFIILDNQNQLWFSADLHFQDSRCNQYNKTFTVGGYLFPDTEISTNKPKDTFYFSRNDKSIKDANITTIGPCQLNSFISLPTKKIEKLVGVNDLPNINLYYSKVIGGFSNKVSFLILQEIKQKTFPMHLFSSKHFRPGHYEHSFDRNYEFILDSNR